MLERSTPSSAATRRATGEAFTRASSGVAVVAAGRLLCSFYSGFLFLGRRGFFSFRFRRRGFFSFSLRFLFLFLFPFGFVFFLGRLLAFLANERDLVANVYFLRLL